VFSVDQLFYGQTNIEKFGKWFPENHFPKNKHSLSPTKKDGCIEPSKLEILGIVLRWGWF